MTEHKFTDDEIMRALECCSRNVPLLNSCEDCPFYGKRCAAFLPQVALNLIKRYKAENERFEKENNAQFDKWKRLDERTKERYAELYEEAKGVVRTEAIKEFAERLKEKIRVMDRIIIYGEDIDNLVKEMTEGGDG